MQGAGCWVTKMVTKWTEFFRFVSPQSSPTAPSVASPICQEGQSERTFSIFLFFPIFPEFCPPFSRFLANFLLSGVYSASIDPPSGYATTPPPPTLLNSLLCLLVSYSTSIKELLVIFSIPMISTCHTILSIGNITQVSYLSRGDIYYLTEIIIALIRIHHMKLSINFICTCQEKYSHEIIDSNAQRQKILIGLHIFMMKRSIGHLQYESK